MGNKEVVAEIMKHLQSVMDLMKGCKDNTICGIRYSALEKDKIEICVYDSSSLLSGYKTNKTQHEYYDKISCEVGNIELTQIMLK